MLEVRSRLPIALDVQVETWPASADKYLWWGACGIGNVCAVSRWNYCCIILINGAVQSHVQLHSQLCIPLVQWSGNPIGPTHKSHQQPQNLMAMLGLPESPSDFCPSE